MADPTQEQLDKIKAAHPGIELYALIAASADGSRSVSVIVKVPDRARWIRFKEQAADKNRKALATESLVRDCVLHPGAAELDSMIEKRPGLVESFGAEIAALAGIEESVVAKKV